MPSFRPAQLAHFSTGLDMARRSRKCSSTPCEVELAETLAEDGQLGDQHYADRCIAPSIGTAPNAMPGSTHDRHLRERPEPATIVSDAASAAAQRVAGARLPSPEP